MALSRNVGYNPHNSRLVGVQTLVHAKSVESLLGITEVYTLDTSFRFTESCRRECDQLSRRVNNTKSRRSVKLGV